MGRMWYHSSVNIDKWHAHKISDKWSAPCMQSLMQEMGRCMHECQYKLAADNDTDEVSDMPA